MGSCNNLKGRGGRGADGNHLLGWRTVESVAWFTRNDRAWPNSIKEDFIIWSSFFLFHPFFVQLTSRRAERLITAQLLFTLSRTVLIGDFFSIKARVRPHGSYVENFPLWQRRFEILCSSSRNNISRLRAANLRYIVLSKNYLKIFRPNRVFLQVLSLPCCLENASTSLSLTFPYRNKSCSSHFSMQQANQVHSPKFERWEAWRRCSLRPLVLHRKSRSLGTNWMTPLR